MVFTKQYAVMQLVEALGATSRKVAGSIPDGGAFRMFCLLYPSGRTMALGSTQPLTEMSTRDFP